MRMKQDNEWEGIRSNICALGVSPVAGFWFQHSLAWSCRPQDTEECLLVSSYQSLNPMEGRTSEELLVSFGIKKSLYFTSVILARNKPPSISSLKYTGDLSLINNQMHVKYIHVSIVGGLVFSLQCWETQVFSIVWLHHPLSAVVLNLCFLCSFKKGFLVLTRSPHQRFRFNWFLVWSSHWFFF